MTEHAKHFVDGELTPVFGCGECAQALATAGFYSGGEPPKATCPACGHQFDPAEGAVRTTEVAE